MIYCWFIGNISLIYWRFFWHAPFPSPPYTHVLSHAIFSLKYLYFINISLKFPWYHLFFARLIIGGQFRFSHLWYPKYRQSFGNIFLFCFWLIYRPKNPPLIIDGLHHLRYLKYRLSFSNIFWFLIFSSPVVPWLCIPEIYMLKIWSPTKNK